MTIGSFGYSLGYSRAPKASKGVRSIANAVVVLVEVARITTRPVSRFKVHKPKPPRSRP